MRRPKLIYVIIFVVCFVLGIANAIYFRNTASNLSIAIPQTTRVIIPTAPPEGWVRLEGNGVALQLPDTFIGTNMQDWAVQVSTISNKELSAQMNILMQGALKNPDQFALIALDKNSRDNFLTNINIVKTRFSDEPHPLDEIRQAAIKQYGEIITVIESAVIKINDLEVIRLVNIFKSQNITAKQLVYIRIDNNNDAWIINYSTSPNEFDKRLPIFEQSYQSFVLLPH